MRMFFELLDTAGGHIFVCFLLILTGAALWACHVPKSEDLIVGATSVLFGSMRGIAAKPNPPEAK